MKVGRRRRLLVPLEIGAGGFGSHGVSMGLPQSNGFSLQQGESWNTLKCLGRTK